MTPPPPLPTDPTEIFSPDHAISPPNDLGTLITASINPPHSRILSSTTCTIRLLHIPPSLSIDLQASILSLPNLPCLPRHLGVWAFREQVWIVSNPPIHTPLPLLLSGASAPQIERVLSCVAQHALRGLQMLHDARASHGYVRANGMLVLQNGEVMLSDAGVYEIANVPLSDRLCFPGRKTWALPRGGGGNMELHEVDVWDLGVALVEIAEGGAAVARMRQAGRRTPRLVGKARWTKTFHSFVATLFAAAGGGGSCLPTARELLQHEFVKKADMDADGWWEETGREIGVSVDGRQYQRDVIGELYAENLVSVRVPLLCIDDVSTDFFSWQAWKGGNDARPTVEWSFVNMLRQCKGMPLTKDCEQNNSLHCIIDKLDTFLDTACI